MSVASARTIKTEVWCFIIVLVVTVVVKVSALNGDHVCMVQQKYNITKRVKYRAPMSVRTYEWCFSMPPRCSKWSTEMRDLTRLETEERTAEVAVCCPGYKMKDVSCVPICPAGKTGRGCAEECPKGKWGPNCAFECKTCTGHGTCLPVTGECRCQEGWQGERCDMSMNPPSTVEELTITKPVTKPTSSTDNDSTTSRSIGTTTSTERVLTTIIRILPTSTMSPSTATSTNLNTKVVSTTSTRIVSTTLTTPKRTIPATSTIFTTVPTTLMTSAPTTTDKTPLRTDKVDTFGAVIDSTSISKATTLKILNNLTMTTPWAFPTYKSIDTTQQPSKVTNDASKKTIPFTTEAITIPPVINTVLITSPTTDAPVLQTEATTHIEILTSSKAAKENLITDSNFKEVTRKPEINIKVNPTTVKFKPKEIWIRPAQKGELLVETKVKPNPELPKYISATKKDVTTSTTPRTIIVSIIPTSISYATFKKMALTTSSYVPHRNTSRKPLIEAFTRSISASTLSPIKKLSLKSTVNPLQTVTVFKSHTLLTKETTSNATNSMSTNATQSNSSYLTTISSTNSTQKPWIYKTSSATLFVTLSSKPTMTKTTTTKEKVAEHLTSKQFETMNRSNSATTKMDNVTETPKVVIGKTNDTKQITTVRPSTNVTEDPDGEETFHILTEPEHITAVMGEKGTERSSVDLISVISIAGGVMMTVITVAVVIVMLERCKRPRYEEGKMNNIRMQVMIDNNDGPPPYVRSIFNTPLPDPPSTEKCHYQPISTLDRNLKQFMRPVVVQSISPMMLENFRGILECHYDHLPRRSIEFQTVQSRRSLASSLGGFDEPRSQRPNSLAESAIEALKCEAKLDVIDNTTSEPLYAEIPCWRPPSEHAIEIINLNGGEAVTEL